MISLRTTILKKCHTYLLMSCCLSWVLISELILTRSSQSDDLEYGSDEYFEAVKFCVDNKLWSLRSFRDISLDKEDPEDYYRVRFMM